ncbi:MAG TPA: Zn-ribbon containing protein [Candidatus Nanoarchaeia archaeon]|nr:Zn-ribbon containing protein [Candidatus Nanoarchaeia archaeon]
MPHQCVHCSKIYPTASRELLEGCNSCGGHFFFYISDERLRKLNEEPIEIPKEEKKKIERDVRDIAGIPNENEPVVLDIESIRVLGEGKYEIDIVNLFSKNKPVIYKVEEGKYIIDLINSLRGIGKKGD